MTWFHTRRSNSRASSGSSHGYRSSSPNATSVYSSRGSSISRSFSPCQTSSQSQPSPIVISDDDNIPAPVLNAPIRGRNRRPKRLYLDITSDSSIENTSRSAQPRVKRHQPVKLEHESSPEIEFLGSSIKEPDLNIKDTKPAVAVPLKDKGKSKLVTPGSIKITTKLKVDEIEVLTAIPPTWTIPRNKMVYLLDLNNAETQPVRSTGSVIPVDSQIRAEVFSRLYITLMSTNYLFSGSRVMGWFFWAHPG